MKYHSIERRSLTLLLMFPLLSCRSGPTKLDKAMLKKSEKVDFAFEIHTPDLLDKKNKEGR